MHVHCTYIVLYVHYSTLQGYGTNYYSDTEYYEGEWYNGKRSGWGRMYYKDGAVYEGEWFDDKRNGLGLLRLGTNIACHNTEIKMVRLY